jgi:signal transduction histidine kinase
LEQEDDRMDNIVAYFLIISVVLLVGLLVFQQGRIIVSNRLRREQNRQTAREREATAAILGLSREALNADTREDAFMARFIEYAVRALQGTGAAVVIAREDGSFRGCAVTGTFPPLKDVTAQVEQQLLAHPKKHSEYIREIAIPFAVEDVRTWCRDKGFSFFKDQVPPGFPVDFSRTAPRLALAPIRVQQQIIACVMVVSTDEFDAHKLDDADGAYLVRLNEIATLSLEGIRMFQERELYQERLQGAREEGMLQVSTGIIHNIGNAVTVAKLSVLDLKEKHPAAEDSPESLILGEILPRIEEKLAAGDLATFLSVDAQGCRYLPAMRELLDHSLNTRKAALENLRSLSEKLYHISEIIELQQRFMGELGTENLASLGTVMQSSIKIFEETCNKRGVAIHPRIESTPEVVIDTSMMTQVFMNLIKNAVEAMEAEGKPEKKYHLELNVHSSERNAQPCVVAEISDNGPGIPEEIRARIFDFGFSTKDQGKAGRGYGLHSCRDTVKKYGGAIEIESELGKGTTFRLFLPAGKRDAA